MKRYTLLWLGLFLWGCADENAPGSVSAEALDAGAGDAKTESRADGNTQTDAEPEGADAGAGKDVSESPGEKDSEGDTSQGTDAPEEPGDVAVDGSEDPDEDTTGLPGDGAIADAEGDPGDDSVAEDTAKPAEDVEFVVEYDAPDSIRINHMQALGTHNSYHKISPFADVIYQWQYEHLPLDQQMEEQGIRQFELDIYHDAATGNFKVYHVIGADEESTCETLTECLAVLKSWSDTHPTHHPFLVLLEVKSYYTDEKAPGLLADLDARLLEVWPTSRLVTPDWVRGEYETVRDALAEVGWPSMNSARGKGIFILHAGGDFANVYTQDAPSAEGRPIFPDAYGDTEKPYAAFHSMNDAIGSQLAIQERVALGHLVRTRCDSDTEEWLVNDYSKYEAALSSGAHFLSTDFPGIPYQDEYAVGIPDGTPSRCNPISAPADCETQWIEAGLWSP